MNLEQKVRQKAVIRKLPTDEVLSQVEKGQKFIVVQDDIDPDLIPMGYTLIDMKYKGESFKTLVPQQLMFFLANPGEGSLDDALDEISDFYEDIEDYEDDEIENGETNVQDADWATTTKDAYLTYIINKLTTNGKDFDEKVTEELNLKNPYVEQRMKGIAALCLDKSINEINKSEISGILKHVSINYNVKEKVTRREIKQVKCWAGSHYEIRNEYKDITRNEIVTKTKEYEVLDRKVSDLMNEIQNYRVKQGKKIGRHDDSLIREYINLSYIAKENPRAQLDIKPAEKKEEKNE